MRFKRRPPKDNIPSQDTFTKEPLNEEQVEAQAPSWYDNWRSKVYTWVSHNAGTALADILMMVPDTFLLLARLATDRRVPFLVKGQLLLATAYVLSPFDLIPEALLGVAGLADDAGVIALVLLWVKNVIGIDKTILNEHWSGQNDPAEAIDNLHRQVMQNADQLFDKDVWQRIRDRFNKQPEIVEGELVQHDEVLNAQHVQTQNTPDKEQTRWRLRFRRHPHETARPPQRKQRIEITT